MIRKISGHMDDHPTIESGNWNSATVKNNIIYSDWPQYNCHHCEDTLISYQAGICNCFRDICRRALQLHVSKYSIQGFPSWL